MSNMCKASCARSPTEEETRGDKFDSVVANSQTDVKSFFTQGEGQRDICPGIRHAVRDASYHHITYAIPRKFEILHTAYNVVV